MKPYFIQSVFSYDKHFLGHLLSRAYHDVQPELVYGFNRAANIILLRKYRQKF